jgi:SOS-response transcriptional repressor LexA
MELTRRRQQICEFIARFTTENGFAPTLREIGDGVGIASTAAVQYQILALERAGALSRKEGYSRTIVLAPEFRMTQPKRTTPGGLGSCGTHAGLSQRGVPHHAE